jgi:hypothetical protein
MILPVSSLAEITIRNNNNLVQTEIVQINNNNSSSPTESNSFVTMLMPAISLQHRPSFVCWVKPP